MIMMKATRQHLTVRRSERRPFMPPPPHARPLGGWSRCPTVFAYLSDRQLRTASSVLPITRLSSRRLKAYTTSRQG